MYYSVVAPAKVNFLLKILGVFEDGYHELNMFMERVGLCDELKIRRINSGITLEVLDSKILGSIDNNLAYKAAKLFIERTQIKEGVHIELKKNIPIAAGLGGGSSDAAAVLRALNVMFESELSDSQLAEMGLELGSDVPFFCYKSAAWVKGRGEKVRPVRAKGLNILIVNPKFPLSTPLVYKMWDELQEQNVKNTVISSANSMTISDLIEDSRGLTPLKVDASSALEKSAIGVCFQNDLEMATFKISPEVRDLKERVLALGARMALVSGSGPSVFGMFDSEKSCEVAAMQLPKGFDAWAVKTLSPGVEDPVREE